MTPKKILKAQFNSHIIAVVWALLATITFGTIVFRYLEDWTWIQSCYFTVSTLATVGYGDLYPTSEISRIFTTFYMIFGIAVYLSCIGIVGASYLQKIENRIEFEQIRQIENEYWSIAIKHFQKIENIMSNKNNQIKNLLSTKKKIIDHDKK